MKNTIFLILVASFLISCATPGHVAQKRNSAKLKSFSLAQTLETQSTDSEASTKDKPGFKIVSSYHFEEKKNTRPLVTVNFKVLSPRVVSELQPDIFIELGNEKIRIAPENHMQNNTIIIPENLWISIVHATNKGWILYSGKESITLPLTSSQASELEEFLKKAMEIRDEKFPAVPEGKKKW